MHSLITTLFFIDMHAKVGISLENRLSQTWASHTISRKLFILVHVIYDHDIWQYMDVDSFDVQYLFDDGNGKGEPLVTFLYTSLGCKCTLSFRVQITFHNFPSKC